MRNPRRFHISGILVFCTIRRFDAESIRESLIQSSSRFWLLLGIPVFRLAVGRDDNDKRVKEEEPSFVRDLVSSRVKELEELRESIPGSWAILFNECSSCTLSPSVKPRLLF